MYQANFNQSLERRELKCTRAFYYAPIQIFSLTATLAIFFFAFSLFPQNVSAYGPYTNPAPVDIGTAVDFTVIGKTAITSDNLTTYGGNIGVSPAAAAGLTAVTCANMTAGRMYTITAPLTPVGCITTASTSVADIAKLSAATADFDAAYLDARNQSTHPYDEISGAIDIGIGVKGRGVYKYTGATSMDTDLVLRGNDTDIWIFQINGAKTQAAAINMVLQNEAGVVDGANGPRARNIFWAVDGAPSQGAGTHFVGVVIATGAIAVGAGSTYLGRAFSDGAVSAATSNFNTPIEIEEQATLVTVGQTITASTFFSSPSFAPLSTTGGSGTGTVSFVVTTAGTAGCSIDGTTLSYSTGGTCTVTATKAGDSSYFVATSTPATFTVNLRNKGTIVTNQGAGTYSFNVTSGTLDASYYEITNTDIYGLNISNTPTISDLSNGVYAINTANGTAITLSSTTIDAYPGRRIYGISFATTTAIAANNVTQTDGTPGSSWWFRNGYGNLYGEAKDNDTGDPGSIKWDDSYLEITVAGTVYTDAGTTALTGGTCDGVTNSVRVVVENGSTYDGTCSAADGTYSIGGVVITGDPTLTVFLNDASGGEYATMVTKSPTANISDADLYVNRVIVRHEDVSAMTIDDMATYDNSDDTDIRYTAATTSAVTLDTFAQTELYVWATTTFTPGGILTLQADSSANIYDGSLYIANGATFTGAGTTTYTVGGIFTQGSGASFIPASSTILMNATTSGKAITAAIGETIAFNQLTFNGTGGGWNMNADIVVAADVYVQAGTVTGTGDITVSTGSFYGNGLVSLGDGITTIETTNTLGGTQGWTFYDLTFGNGAVSGTTTPASTATTTVANVFTIETGHFYDAGAGGIELSGSGTVFVEDGTFLEDTSTIRYSGTSATNILATNYYNLDLNSSVGIPTYTATGIGISVANDLTVGGEAATVVNFDTNDTVLNVDGDLTIRANGTLLGSDSAAFTVAGSWDTNGVYTASGGTITFDGTGTQTIAAGSSDFATVDITGTGAYIISEHATATTAFTLSNTSVFTLASGQMLAVGGVFTNNVGGASTTWDNTTLSLYGGGNYLVNATTTSELYNIVLVDANTDIRMWNSVATTTTTLAGGSLYSMDHASVDGDLYIFGAYEKNSGTDHWSYATDFDGVDLSGGNERKVDVYIEGGNSVLYQSGGDLMVTGVPAASTTMQNQGSGVYSFDIGNTGSTTMTYYTFENVDADGLTFSGAPDVSTLSYGSYMVANNADTAITVAGSVITANPSLTFSNNVFATTSGVTSAVNVTVTGTTASGWRFTAHSGDISGETFDSDPAGDPGYIIWDNSTSTISISGNIYEADGSTVSSVCDDVTANIVLSIAGSIAQNASSTCASADGSYTIDGFSSGSLDEFIVYINGNSNKGVVVTKDTFSSVFDMDIYENHVIVRHENVTSLSVSDMSVWDSSDDADIAYTAVTGALDALTLAADTKLMVWNDKQFEPGGDVDIPGGGSGSAFDGTLELLSGATFTGGNTEEYTIAGSFLSGAGAVFDSAQSTTTFTSTVAGRTVDTNEGGFYNVIFTGSGDWTISDAVFSVGGEYIKSAGTLTLPSATSTFAGSFTNTGGTFDANGGVIEFTSNNLGNNVQLSSSSANEILFDGTGSWSLSDTNATATANFIVNSGSVTLPNGTLVVDGNFINNDTIIHNSGTVRLTDTFGGNLLTLNGDDLNNLTIEAGGGDYAQTDVASAFSGNLIVQSGSFTPGTSTMSIGGSFDATAGTFVNNSGTVLFNSSDTGESIDPGNNDFYNVVVAGSGGGWTMLSNATTTNNFTLSLGSSYIQSSTTVLYIGEVFTNTLGGSPTTWSGSTLMLDSASEYEINTKTTPTEQYENLIIGNSTDISSWNSAATSTVVAANGSLYSQDNAGVDGNLFIFGDYHISTTTEYWVHGTDFDGVVLGLPRPVEVSISDGSLVTVDGGTLNIIGGE
ncbi:MAG: hypothetical protein ACI92I_000067 [Acidimicrobiales bacterium]|jgi:hypothetical protein